MTYKEKLKDPRWQKKRLEILDRDSWACQNCFDTKSELQIHHRIYKSGDPWDIENRYLVALCKICHEDETKTGVYKEIIDELKTLFLAGNVSDILEGFKETPLTGHPAIFAASLKWLLTDKSKVQKLYNDYLKSISSKKFLENN